MSDDFIRVRDIDTGHEYTIRESQFLKGGHEKLNKPATDPGGTPVPVKHRLPRAKKAAAPVTKPRTPRKSATAATGRTEAVTESESS